MSQPERAARLPALAAILVVTHAVLLTASMAREAQHPALPHGPAPRRQGALLVRRSERQGARGGFCRLAIPQPAAV
jgi:hypothetical protein